MLRPDSLFGCRSNTPYEILAASRSCPNAANGCSCSAAARYLFADSSGPSGTDVLGNCAGLVFTTARCAHPHHWNKMRPRAHLDATCHLFWKLDCMNFFTFHTPSLRNS